MKKRIVYSLIILIVLGLIAWITYLQTATIDQLRAEGKDYNVGAVTVQNGKDGKSTYELAVDQGFEGSLTDFLIAQAVKPIKGEDGQPGASAYDLAIEYGFQGSVIDWLLSLKGQKGEDALQLTDEQQYNNWVYYCSRNVCTGSDGKDGINGLDGKDAPLTTWSCVLRSGSQTDPLAPGITTVWIAYKDTAAPDSAYQDLHTQTDRAGCKVIIDLTGVSL